MYSTISVIITTYNAAKTISDTLESIWAQTYTNYEIIVVDDGSQDNTVEIINSFKNNRAVKCRIIVEGKVGRATALLNACKSSNGDYVAIIDADDIWHPQKLEIQIALMTNQNITFLATNCIVFSCKNNIETKLARKYCLSDMSGQTVKIDKFNALIRNPIGHSSVMMHRTLANYDSGLKSQIDYELWLRLLEYHDLYLTSNELTFHRIHQGQNFEGKGFLGGFMYSLCGSFLRIRYSAKYRNMRAFTINIIFMVGYCFGCTKLLRSLKLKNI